MAKPADLKGDEIPQLAWDPASRAASLEALFRFMEARGNEAIDWYLVSKRRKARWSRWLRALAIALTAIGAFIPILHGIFDGMPEQWGFLALAAAASCVGADRFFGFSGGWMRYMLAINRLEEALHQFQLAWSRRKVELGADGPTPEDVGQAFDLFEAFQRRLNREVRAETQQWVLEFKTSMAQLDGATGRADGKVAGDDDDRGAGSVDRGGGQDG